MKKVLVIANTYYQLIMAIQMKLSIFDNSYVSLLVSDHCNGAVDVARRLKELQVFEECEYFESKGVIRNRGFFRKLIDSFQIITGGLNRYAYYLKDLNEKEYDIFLNHNYEIDTYAVFSLLSASNKSIKYAAYEEGVLSYEYNDYSSLLFTLICAARKILGKTSLLDMYEEFYCVYPEIYEGKKRTIKIPQISSSDTRMSGILKKIFDITHEFDYSKYKYIFFESIYESEGRSIGELNVLLEIAKRVGKNNILVKKHPRSTITAYEENGIAVDKNSFAPFEAIQLNNDFSGCTFITTTSGSVFSTNSLLEDPCKVVLIYPLTSYHIHPELEKFVYQVENVINKFKSRGLWSHINIIHSLDEVF